MIRERCVSFQMKSPRCDAMADGKPAESVMRDQWPSRFIRRLIVFWFTPHQSILLHQREKHLEKKRGNCTEVVMQLSVMLLGD